MKKKIIFILIIILVSISVYAQDYKKQKVLIAYFTWARNKDLSGEVDTTTHASVQVSEGVYKGDTEIVAEWIQEDTGGDLFPIKTACRYSSDFNQAVEEGGRELRQNARPELADTVSNIAGYDIVFLGYPVWWRDVPMVLYTFMDRYDLSGKTILPFATHMGGGLGASVKTIKKLEPGASVLDPLLISDYSLSGSKRKVEKWLEKTGY